MALIDGELSAAEEARIMAQIAGDAKLVAYVEEQKNLRGKLREEFASVLSDPLPARLEDAVLRTPMKPARRGGFDWASLFPSRRLWAPWVAAGAMAAGTALGFLLAPAFDAAPIGSRDGTLIARGELARALNSRLASEEDPTAPPQTRVALTFRSRDGNLCRSFISESGDDDFAGIACRDGEDWRIALLAPADAPAPGNFQQAGAAMPPIVRDGTQAMLQGAPFDAEQERAARDSDWR
jgi:hypothetical protein